MSKGYPLVPIASTGDVQGGRQRSPHMTEGKLVPYLRVANVFDGSINFSDVNEMPFKSQEIDRFRLIKGDILLNEGQSVELVGRCAMFMDGPEDCCYQNTLVRYRASPETDPNFALQLFRYCQLTGVFSKIAVKTNSIAHLGVSRFAELELPFPPYQVQNKIAGILERWDTAIQKTEHLIATKERHYSHELSRLISRGQHPHAHVGAFAEEVTARNRGGKPVLLGDFLTESRDADTEQNTAKRLTVRLHLQGVEARHVRGTESHGATTYFRRRAGQLIYGKQNIFRGAIGIIPPELDNFASTQDLPAFDIADDIDPQWLYFWLSRKDFYASLEALATGSGSKRLHPEEFLKLRVFVPDLATQSEIARYLHALREEIDLLGRSIAALKTQKRGLMQKLLTGQWRLPINDGAYE